VTGAQPERTIITSMKESANGNVAASACIKKEILLPDELIFYRSDADDFVLLVADRLKLERSREFQDHVTVDRIATHTHTGNVANLIVDGAAFENHWEIPEIIRFKILDRDGTSIHDHRPFEPWLEG